MVFWAGFRAFGPLFYLLWGLRYWFRVYDSNIHLPDFWKCGAGHLNVILVITSGPFKGPYDKSDQYLHAMRDAQPPKPKHENFLGRDLGIKGFS